MLQGEPPPPAPPPAPAYEPPPPQGGYEAPPPQGGYEPPPPQPGYQPPPGQGGYEPRYQPSEAPPPLQGEEQPQSLMPPAEQNWQAPQAAPQMEAPAPSAPPAAVQLPADIWRGLDAGAMQTLLQQTPLPSLSPTLAKLIGDALSAGAPYDDREISVRAEALKKAGSVEALATLLRVPVDSLATTGEAGGGAASPVELYFLAQDGREEPEVRLAAAERAASLNIIGGEALTRAYREVAPKLPKSARSPAALRARLFASLDAQSAAATQAESVDALFASAKDAGIEAAMAGALAPISDGLARSPEAGRYAATGIRVAALAGEDQAGWDWVQSGGARVQSYELLLAAADPYGPRARSALESGVEIATRTHLPGEALQRLVTLLDALGEEVPIPLWDFASRTPPPQGGFLPETGVLSALKEAVDRGETGRTILLAAIAIGPKGPRDTHLIALGDAIRALKRVGLEREARRIALEALIGQWPSQGKG